MNDILPSIIVIIYLPSKTRYIRNSANPTCIDLLVPLHIGNETHTTQFYSKPKFNFINTNLQKYSRGGLFSPWPMKLHLNWTKSCRYWNMSNICHGPTGLKWTYVPSIPSIGRPKKSPTTTIPQRPTVNSIFPHAWSYFIVKNRNHREKIISWSMRASLLNNSNLKMTPLIRK